MSTDSETTEEQAESSRRPMDAEVKAISAILRILDDVTPPARRRIMAYLVSRYEGPL